MTLGSTLELWGPWAGLNELGRALEPDLQCFIGTERESVVFISFNQQYYIFSVCFWVIYLTPTPTAQCSALSNLLLVVLRGLFGVPGILNFTCWANALTPISSISFFLFSEELENFIFF